MKRVQFVGILAAIFIFVFPFVNSHKMFYAPMNAKAFYTLGAAVIFAVFYAYEMYKGHIKSFLPSRDNILFCSSCAVLGTSILAAFLGINAENSFFGDIIRGTGTILVISLVIMAYLLSGLLKNKDWRLVGFSLVISSAFYSFLSFVDIFFSPGGETGLSAPGFLFGNSTFAGTFVLIGIIVTLIAILDSYQEKNGKNKWLYPLLALQFLHPAILNSGILFGDVGVAKVFAEPALLLGDAQASSATAFIVVIFVLLRYVILRFSKSKDAMKIFSGIFGGIIVVVLGLLFVPGSFVQEKYSANSSDARIILWESAFESVKDRPVLGYGPENFELAYQSNFDNRLFLEENLGEIWFDRAHNYFIDTLVEVGFLGLLAWLVMLFLLARTFVRASKRGLISDMQAQMLVVLICAQILQMQTSFQTVVTYFYIFVLLGYGLYIEREMVVTEETNKNYEKMVIVPAALIFLIAFVPQIIFTLKGRQQDLVEIMKTRDNAEREAKIENAIRGGHSLVSLRIGSGSLIKGVMARLGSDQPLTPESRSQALKEMEMYAKAYEEYIELRPNYYRARVNLAYLYMFETILGNERLDKAKALLAGSAEFSPENPLTPAMEALAYMYGGDFKTAEAKIAEAEALNPEIEFVQDVKAHVVLQKTRFPKITFLSLDNL